MTTRTLTKVSAALEMAVGFALMVVPDLVTHLLIGANLSSAGMAVGRVGGFGLLSLGIAGWPGAEAPTAHATLGLFTYNLLAALYFLYLGAFGGFFGYLLWPAFVLHALLTVLFARPAYDAIRRNG